MTEKIDLVKLLEGAEDVSTVFSWIEKKGLDIQQEPNLNGARPILKVAAEYAILGDNRVSLEGQVIHVYQSGMNYVPKKR
jgi:hypothetical protein